MHHRLLEIPEIANFGAGRGLVRIPGEIDVPFTPRVRAIVDTPEFRRLRSITQLGFASQVYPGATHTRFEHALGVFHNTLRYLRQLGADERFRAQVDPHLAEVLLVASLLHDLGHWPFCHPIEDMGLDNLPPHEAFAEVFLAPGRELANVLKSEWNVDPGEVLDVLAPRTNTPSMRLVRSILSGPIDADKMDYLDRDSLHAGVPYGRNFDRSRLIQSLVVNKAGDGLAITSKGRTAAELMVFARYVMFSEVYWHHAVRAATSMFARSFFGVQQNFELTSLFQLSETEFIERLRAAARGTSCEVLLEGLFGAKRLLYKRVAEFSVYQEPELYAQLARRPYREHVNVAAAFAGVLQRELGEPVAETDLLIDAPPQHREIEFNVQIYFEKERVYRPFHEVSPVVEALARRQFDDYVKRVRIFAHPRFARRVSQLDRFPELLASAIAESA